VVQLWRYIKIIIETDLYFFPSMSIFKDENFCCWEECNILENNYIIKTNLKSSFRDK